MLMRTHDEILHHIQGNIHHTSHLPPKEKSMQLMCRDPLMPGYINTVPIK